MTPERLKECLDTLGYSQRGFSQWAGFGTDTVRNWARGKSQVPEPIEDWLERAVDWFEQNPIPPKNDGFEA